MSDLKPYIAKLATGAELTRLEARGAFEVIMSGSATPAQVGGLLMAMRVRGESIEEITGAAEVLRDKALTVKAPRTAVDTCGTGGDNAGTYNISTAAAIVAAAAGVTVAKHGNRAVSSKSGSADVLECMGIDLEAPMERVQHALDVVGISFFMAPRHHSAMRYVASTRGELGTRTLFNILGPLANPAGVRRQVLGVFARQWVEPLAHVLQALGSVHAWVVHGADGLDELSTTGPTFVAELKRKRIRTFEITPEDAGLKRTKLARLRGGNAKKNATAMKRLFSGVGGPYRDIVLLNTAAALIVGGKVKTLKEGVALAANAIDSGAAAAKLDAWRQALAPQD